MQTLFDEAIEALRNVTILSKEDGNAIVSEFENTFPFIPSGNGRANAYFFKQAMSINTFNIN